MSKKSTIKFKLLELKAFVDDPNSCVKCVRKNQHLSVAPWCLSNLKTSIESILNRKTARYDKSLDGILLSARNISLLSSTGAIRHDSPEIHLNIEADFYIFQPVIGCVLEGVIVKKSNQFLGCLVHNVFNISIPKVGTQKQWPGQYMEIGQTVVFKVVSMDLLGKLPYIRGEIDASNMDDYDDETMDTSELQSVIEDIPDVPQKKRKKDKKKNDVAANINGAVHEEDKMHDVVPVSDTSLKKQKKSKTILDIENALETNSKAETSFSKIKRAKVVMELSGDLCENKEVKRKKSKDKNKDNSEKSMLDDCIQSYTKIVTENKTITLNKDKYKLAKVKSEPSDGYSSENMSTTSFKERKNSCELSSRRSPMKFKKNTDSTGSTSLKNNLINELLNVARERSSISPLKKNKQSFVKASETLLSTFVASEKNNNGEIKSERKNKRKAVPEDPHDATPVKKVRIK